MNQRDIPINRPCHRWLEITNRLDSHQIYTYCTLPESMSEILHVRKTTAWSYQAERFGTSQSSHHTSHCKPLFDMITLRHDLAIKSQWVVTTHYSTSATHTLDLMSPFPSDIFLIVTLWHPQQASLLSHIYTIFFHYLSLKFLLAVLTNLLTYYLQLACMNFRTHAQNKRERLTRRACYYYLSAPPLISDLWGKSPLSQGNNITIPLPSLPPQ